MRSPSTTLMAAAISDRPKLSLSAASTRAVRIVSKNPEKPSVAALSTRPESGISTITLSHIKVRPSVIPKPGITLGLRQSLVGEVTVIWRPRKKGVGPRALHPRPLRGRGRDPMRPSPPSGERGFLQGRENETCPQAASIGRFVDLVEDAAIGEMCLLRLLPAAEFVIDGEEGNLGEGILVLRSDRCVAWPVGVLRHDLLRLRRIKEVQIGFRLLAGALRIDDLVDHSDRRLSEDTFARRHDLEFIAAEFLERQEGFVLPGEQDIADAAFDEGHGRTARAGVEYRHIAVEIGDEIACRGLILVVLVKRIAPGGEIIPPGPARCLRIGGD